MQSRLFLLISLQRNITACTYILPEVRSRRTLRLFLSPTTAPGNCSGSGKMSRFRLRFRGKRPSRSGSIFGQNVHAPAPAPARNIPVVRGKNVLRTVVFAKCAVIYDILMSTAYLASKTVQKMLLPLNGNRRHKPSVKLCIIGVIDPSRSRAYFGHFWF